VWWGGGGTLVVATTRAPKRNLQFLKELKSYKEMSELTTWGELPYADVLEALVQADERRLHVLSQGIQSVVIRAVVFIGDDSSSSSLLPARRRHPMACVCVCACVHAYVFVCAQVTGRRPATFTVWRT
jgi:hypothetical protein